MREAANQKPARHWYRFSLRRLLAFSILLGLAIGSVLIRQQRQQEYFRIVEFVERTFDSGGVIPNEIASKAKPVYSHINGNRWVFSVAHSPNNGPAFISSEHELIYCPSSNGSRLVDLTVLTSWHFLRSKPEILIKSGGGIYDDAAVKRLKQLLVEQFQVEPIFTPIAG